MDRLGLPELDLPREEGASKRWFVPYVFVIVILVAGYYLLLRPAMQAAEDTSSLGYAYGRMKDLAIGMYMYQEQHHTFPAAGGGSVPGSQLSWRVRILPMLGEEALYAQFHLDEPWDSEHNRTLIPKMPDVFKCVEGSFPVGQTPYLAVTGPGTAFDDLKIGRPLSEFTDGDGKTIVLVEADRGVEWTKPEDWQFDPGDPTRGLGELRQHGFLVGFANCRIYFIDTDTLPAVVRSLMTRAGGETTVMPWLSPD